MRRKVLASSAVALLLGLIGLVASGTFAIFHAETANSGNTFSASNDFVAPVIDTNSVIASTIGGTPVGSAGFVSGLAGSPRTYKVYANVTDNSVDMTTGTVTGDVSSITTGATTVALGYDSTGVKFGATTYHWISSEQTAKSGLTGGPFAYSISAADSAGNTAGTTASANKPVLDSTVPSTPSMTDPGTPLTGNVTLAATTVADAGSGVASEIYEKSPNLAGTFTTACTGTISPFSCSFNTASVSDGAYDFRSRTIDNAGNSATSALRSNKLIDNTNPTLTFDAIGASPLSGTVNLTATSADGTGSGVANVTFQYAATGSGTWINACAADTSSPYSCAFDTTTITDDATYDFRAVSTDKVGRTTTSATQTRDVGNPPKAVDVQTNAGNNIPSSGDTVTYTFSEAVKPATILSGWDGTNLTGLSVRVVQNGTTDDLLQVFSGATQVNIGVHDLMMDFVTGGTNGTSWVAFNSSSMVLTSGTTLTVTLGGTATNVNGASLGPAPGKGKMQWGVNSNVEDLAGHKADTTQVIELGGNDNDF